MLIMNNKVMKKYARALGVRGGLMFTKMTYSQKSVKQPKRPKGVKPLKPQATRKLQ